MRSFNVSIVALFFGVLACGSFAHADVLGPSISHVDAVSRYSSDSYTMTFRAGSVAKVYVNGDGDTDLDVYIYDDNGNLITCDTRWGDDCVVAFIPYVTSNFTIRIVNLGSVTNTYNLVVP